MTEQTEITEDTDRDCNHMDDFRWFRYFCLFRHLFWLFLELATKTNYTFCSFQRPRRNSHMAMMARMDSAMVIARKMPFGPRPAHFASP